MRHLIHKIVVWYLRRCAGAFHAYPYGPTGRYVVLMTDWQYHIWKQVESRRLRQLRKDDLCPACTHFRYHDGHGPLEVLEAVLNDCAGIYSVGEISTMILTPPISVAIKAMADIQKSTGCYGSIFVDEMKE